MYHLFHAGESVSPAGEDPTSLAVREGRRQAYWSIKYWIDSDPDQIMYEQDEPDYPEQEDLEE